MFVKRIIALAIVRIMAFASWMTMAMRHVNVWVNGLDVGAIIHQFALNDAVTVVRLTRSMNACKQLSPSPIIRADDLRMTVFFKFHYCRCSDGTISPCIYENYNNAADVEGSSQEGDNEGNVLTILSALIAVFVILILVFGTAIYLLRYPIEAKSNMFNCDF